MVLTRSRTFGWSTPCAASISCGPEQTPRRRIAPLPKRAALNRPEEIVPKPFAPPVGDSQPSASRKRKHEEDASDVSPPPRKLPRVTLIVRPPKLFITIPRRQVLARISHNNRTITLLGRRRISVVWRPAHTSAPAVRSVSEPAPTRRSQRILSRQASVA